VSFSDLLLFEAVDHHITGTFIRRYSVFTTEWFMVLYRQCGVWPGCFSDEFVRVHRPVFPFWRACLVLLLLLLIWGRRNGHCCKNSLTGTREKHRHSLCHRITGKPHRRAVESFRHLDTIPTRCLGCFSPLEWDLPSSSSSRVWSSGPWPAQVLSKFSFDCSPSNNRTCNDCWLGKHVRLLFSSSTTTALFPFLLLHCDVCTSPIISISSYKLCVR
jgi:hypothetical protein